MSHNHTRSDFPQIYSPRITTPRLNPPATRCSPAIERRIRSVLTWHAGTAGLIDAGALDDIARMWLASEVTMSDLRVLCSDGVYAAICERLEVPR